MLFVRADIVKHSARYLARATTIAIRYCCVRRQTAPAAGEQELQVGVAGLSFDGVTASFVSFCGGARAIPCAVFHLHGWSGLTGVFVGDIRPPQLSVDAGP